jgi:hypothetical protein
MTGRYSTSDGLVEALGVTHVQPIAAEVPVLCPVVDHDTPLPPMRWRTRVDLDLGDHSRA